MINCLVLEKKSSGETTAVDTRRLIFEVTAFTNYCSFVPVPLLKYVVKVVVINKNILILNKIF